MRSGWSDLCGAWDFAIDTADEGLDQSWHSPDASYFDRRITVPYPPESPASGVNATDHLGVVWYRRKITAADLRGAGETSPGDRTLLHFGAVDYACDVWLDGQHLARHVGGQTPFSVDITVAARGAGSRPLTLVVRAEDDPVDVSQPRGKQDWQVEPHVIWYDRTTGIWQPVWLEHVPAVHIEEISWACDTSEAQVELTVTLNQTPRTAFELDLSLTCGDELLAQVATLVRDRDSQITVSVPRQTNGQDYESLLWSPDQPTLIDAAITLRSADSTSPADQVASYLGLRSVSTHGNTLLLNDRPFPLRSVLEQGFWPQTHLAAPSADALRAEVQLIKDLGFNSARVHQKAEDPRFLFWADRLGLTIWAETANAYAFTGRAVEMLTREWLDLVRRDRSHPSIIAWVPMNESWGVQHISHDPAQQQYTVALAALTRSLDPTRPVISNDGWEHTDSDIWTIHDYEPSGEVLRERYGSDVSVHRLFAGMGPAGRRLRLTDVVDPGMDDRPVMLTEFGGVNFAADRSDAWGYSTATDEQDFAERVGGLLTAAREAEPLAGFCWTQLTDTGQETNGLLYADRSPKIPIATLRRLVTGDNEL
ncbi:glycoside hydrolase family 2 TIM barrel-domain containing protein [Paraoerskovia marina]|uniref:glycoside hydrolase family 2 TIM barrel-domain containing protein n=1 Tax=Paraoerskovia marina TaxID=545619 RepID=UPI00069461B7|nr:glycoside hydrolase family 2 TIM barrel-domain containing protein [Paraoerskovia marina]